MTSAAQRTRLRIRALLFLGSSFLLAAPLAGWGSLGHRVVAEIAQERLSPAARQRALELLDGASLARVSTWADDHKLTPEGEETSSWHWMDLEAGEALEERSRRYGEDLLDVLLRERAVLANGAASRDERAAALRWLVHLVADAHQPLHVGLRADRGGNDVAVTWLGETTNLHFVWDLHLPVWPRLSYTEWAEFLVAEISKQEAEHWAAAPVAAWIEESRALRREIYPAPSGDGETGPPALGGPYAAAHLPAVERRLQQAGVRLAALLEGLLGAEPVSPPARNGTAAAESPPG